jgi:hypothetical protein
MICSKPAGVCAAQRQRTPSSQAPMREEDVMPLLKFTNDEFGTLLHALPTEAGEWLRYKTFHGSAQNINSVSRILESVNALEERVQELYDNMTDEDDEEPIDTQITEAEAKRRLAVAEMIIAEIQVGEALHGGSIGPFLGGYPARGDGLAPQSRMAPSKEIHRGRQG